MSVSKMLKKLTSNHLVMILAAGAILYVLSSYSTGKSTILSAMTAGLQNNGGPGQSNVVQYNPAAGPASSCPGVGGQNYGPSSPLGQNSAPGSANGVGTSVQGLPPSCSQQQVVDPKELLPKDSNSQFSQLNPMGSGDLQDVSLLKAGYHIGINTIGNSLRNANLQLRSEPANPQLQIGPWNNTTIAPDNRRPMEVGCGPM